MSCIFCQIASGKAPAQMLHQDDEIVAFRDIRPKAPTHILVVPRKHITALNEVTQTDLPLISKMTKVANDLAVKEGVSGKGYRVIINCGRAGNQVVGHLHMHLLGGRQLSGHLG